MAAIVITGNPVDGLVFWGPFDGPEYAEQWAINQGAFDWLVADLEPASDGE